jgi:fibronectin-binding autotransporter adhesin
MEFIRPLVTSIAVLTLGGAGVVTGRAASSPTTGTSVTVCASGCTYTTISAALTAASSGEVIKVGAGTYAGGFVIRTPVTIQGANRGTTIIRGGASNNGTVVDVEANPVTISGVTITGGTWSSTSGETGGGVVTGSGVLNLKNCYITGNQGNDGSGGGGINSYATTNIIGCQINGNTAGGGQGQGGGIHVGGRGVVNITNGTIESNTAGRGGGIDIDIGGSLTLQGTQVEGNRSAHQGGGIDNNGSLTVTGARINKNTVGGEGGGMIQNGSAKLSNSYVVRNQSTGGVGNGGGIFVTSGHTVTLNNTPVIHNIPDNLVQG